MWLVALILFWGVLLLLVATLQRGRGEAVVATGHCPSCYEELVHLAPDPAVQPRRTWEVVACPQCEVASTVVQGVPGRAAWCPACRQRALELQVTRLEGTSRSPVRIEVTERCHLCNHEAQVLVEQGTTARAGRVIPFPGDRER